MYSVPFHAARKVSLCLWFLLQIKSGTIFEDPLNLQGEPSRIPCSVKYLLWGGGRRDICADLQISHVGSVPGEELTSMVSSVAIEFTTCTDRCLQIRHSGEEVPEEEEKQERLDVLWWSEEVAGWKKTGVTKVELSSLGCHAQQKASEKSPSH